jgi:hypothetical protein
VQPAGQIFVSTIWLGLISIVFVDAVVGICPYAKLGIIKLEINNKPNNKELNFTCFILFIVLIFEF